MQHFQFVHNKTKFLVFHEEKTIQIHFIKQNSSNIHTLHSAKFLQSSLAYCVSVLSLHQCTPFCPIVVTSVTRQQSFADRRSFEGVVHYACRVKVVTQELVFPSATATDSTTDMARPLSLHCISSLRHWIRLRQNTV